MSGGRVIFIGNIPYGVTDEVIVDIFSRVGQVVSYRALTDKETGKPRGYAFAEFADADAAASAVRNLNDYELQGRRLKVDYANDKNDKDEGAPPVAAPSAQVANTLPPLPPGRDLGPSLTAEDAISKTLNTLPPSQLLDILQQMQNLVVSEPVRAQALLEQSPQLSYAIFQALLLLQLVDTATLTSIIQATSAMPAQPAPPVQQYQPPAAAVPTPQPAYQQPQSYPAQFTPQGFPNTGTPVAQPYSVPTPQPPQQPPPPPAAAQDPQKAALIQQVLSMSQQQIDALPPVERGQIMMLRAQLLQGRAF